MYQKEHMLRLSEQAERVKLAKTLQNMIRANKGDISAVHGKSYSYQEGPFSSNTQHNTGSLENVYENQSFQRIFKFETVDDKQFQHFASNFDSHQNVQSTPHELDDLPTENGPIPENQIFVYNNESVSNENGNQYSTLQFYSPNTKRAGAQLDQWQTENNIRNNSPPTNKMFN